MIKERTNNCLFCSSFLCKSNKCEMCKKVLQHARSETENIWFYSFSGANNYMLISCCVGNKKQWPKIIAMQTFFPPSFERQYRYLLTTIVKQIKDNLPPLNLLININPFVDNPCFSQGSYVGILSKRLQALYTRIIYLYTFYYWKKTRDIVCRVSWENLPNPL